MSPVSHSRSSFKVLSSEREGGLLCGVISFWSLPIKAEISGWRSRTVELPSPQVGGPVDWIPRLQLVSSEIPPGLSSVRSVGPASVSLCISKSILSSVMVRMKVSPPTVIPTRLGSVETYRKPVVLGDSFESVMSSSSELGRWYVIFLCLGRSDRLPVFSFFSS